VPVLFAHKKIETRSDASQSGVYKGICQHIRPGKNSSASCTVRQANAKKTQLNQVVAPALAVHIQTISHRPIRQYSRQNRRLLF